MNSNNSLELKQNTMLENDEVCALYRHFLIEGLRLVVIDQYKCAVYSSGQEPFIDTLNRTAFGSWVRRHGLFAKRITGVFR